MISQLQLDSQGGITVVSDPEVLIAEIQGHDLS